MNQNSNPVISWTGTEYEEKEHSPDWYWAVGIITISITTISILFKNYLFSLLVIVGAMVLFMFAIRKPRTIKCEISDSKINIGGALYYFDDITSFHIIKSEKNFLLIKSQKHIFPLTIINLKEAPVDKIENYLSEHLKKEKMELPLSRIVMDRLGF